MLNLPSILINSKNLHTRIYNFELNLFIFDEQIPVIGVLALSTGPKKCQEKR